jgi:hypothetical protein
VLPSLQLQLLAQASYLCYNEAMLIEERVVLPLPLSIKDIQLAADQFAEQYACITWLELRGQVLLENGQSCFIQDWHTIGQLDADLELFGLGMPGDSDESLCWVAATAAAELRLSPMEEEN